MKVSDKWEIIQEKVKSAFGLKSKIKSLRQLLPHTDWERVHNTLLDLQNSSYPTQPHSIIAKYYHPRQREAL